MYGRFALAWLSRGVLTMGAKWTRVAQRFPGSRHCLHETEVLFA